jgi:tetratricopeptide (TPR) repeat protein
MLDFFLIVLVLISLAVIASIVGRKFPALASLDLSTIVKEKEARFKEQIVSQRLKRTIMLRWNKFGGWLKPVMGAIANFSRMLYAKALELRDKQRAEKHVSPEELEKQVERLVDDAESLSRQDDFEVAEKKLIEAIGLDSKNIEAFRALAHLYFEKRDYEEARQTFEHVLKLHENDEDAYEGLATIDRESGNYPNAKAEYQELLRLNNLKSETYFNLALVSEAMKEYHESLNNIKKALALEGNNPRYLDLWLRISIIIKDKVNAYDAYTRMKEVNPENGKLEELKAQIDEL